MGGNLLQCLQLHGRNAVKSVLPGWILRRFSIKVKTGNGAPGPRILFREVFRRKGPLDSIVMSIASRPHQQNDSRRATINVREQGRHCRLFSACFLPRCLPTAPPEASTRATRAAWHHASFTMTAMSNRKAGNEGRQLAPKLSTHVTQWKSVVCVRAWWRWQLTGRST